MIKRMLDLSIALPAILLLAPVLMGIAVLIRLDSSGPALFRQQRIGRHGRPFRTHKFRTMCVDGESLGPQVTVAQDARITQFGSTLRRFKLDELPQLIDVIFGDMSLVGPRPEVPRYVTMWPENARREILALRPGITDPVSLEFFDEAAILSAAADPERAYVEEVLPRKIEGYLRYARTRSLRGDLRLVARTVWRALRA